MSLGHMSFIWANDLHCLVSREAHLEVKLLILSSCKVFIKLCAQNRLYCTEWSTVFSYFGFTSSGNMDFSRKTFLIYWKVGLKLYNYKLWLLCTVTHLLFTRRLGTVFFSHYFKWIQRQFAMAHWTDCPVDNVVQPAYALSSRLLD